MTTIVVDAGPLYAAFDRDDSYHAAAVRFIETNGSFLLTNVPVITEVTYLLRRSPKTRIEFLKWADVAFNIEDTTAEDCLAS